LLWAARGYVEIVLARQLGRWRLLVAVAAVIAIAAVPLHYEGQHDRYFDPIDGVCTDAWKGTAPAVMVLVERVRSAPPPVHYREERTGYVCEASG
jgi:hypothetical protein